MLVDARQRFIAESMQENFIRLVDSYRPVFLASGQPESEVDELIAAAKDEVRNTRVKMYAKVRLLLSLKFFLDADAPP